jgi:hypothetical protein
VHCPGRAKLGMGKETSCLPVQCQIVYGRGDTALCRPMPRKAAMDRIRPRMNDPATATITTTTVYARALSGGVFMSVGRPR